MLTKLRTLLAGMGIGSLLTAGVLLWIIGSEGCRFHRDAKIAAAVVEAIPTARSLEIKGIPYDCPGSGPLFVLQPTEKQAAKIENDYQLPDGSVGPQEPGRDTKFRVLGETVLPKLEWGGTALSGLDESGKSVVLVKPKPEPLLELPARWSFYVEGAYMFNEQGGSLNNGRRYSIGAQYDAFRFARFHLEPIAEVGHRIPTGSYAEAGLRLSFKTH